MPSFKDTLELVLHADSSGAISELKRFSGETEAQVKKSESSLQRISAGALKIGAAGMGAGALLTSLGDEATAATQQLDQAISAAGQSAEEYKGKIDDAVSSDEKFGHTAHETENALTTLVNSYGDTGKALDRMQLVEDIAAVRHISLASAADLVAKAHGGSAKVFKQFGIQVETNADGTKNYEAALDKLTQKVSGQASASMAGFTGWLKGVGAAVEDDVATFAQKFGPAILGVSTGLTALGGIGTGVTAVLGKMKTARLAATAADEAGTAASTGLATKLGAVGIAAGLAAAAYEGYTHSETVNIDVSKASRASTEELVNQFKGLEHSMFGSKNALDLFTQLAETSTPTAQRLRDELAAQGEDVSKLDAVLQREAAAQKQATQDTKESVPPLQEAAAETKKLTDAVKKLDDAYRSIVDSTLDSFTAALHLTDAEIQTRAAVDALNKAQADGATTADALTKAQDDVFEAILAEAKASEDNADAQAKANGQTLAARDAQAAVIAELLKVADTLAPGSALRQRVEDYVAQLQNDIPERVSTKIAIDADQALTDLASVLEYIDQINRGLPAFAGPGFNVTPPGYVPQLGGPDSNPPGNDVGGGGGNGPPRTTQVFNITATDPVQAGNEIAQHQRAQQFLGVR